MLKIRVCTSVLVYAVCALSPFNARASEGLDWFFEPNKKAFEIYDKKKVQISCSNLERLIENDKLEHVYQAIRDAAIFRDKTCKTFIKSNYSLKNDKLRMILMFYNFRIGEQSDITELFETYDKQVKQSYGDHYIVPLFGFLNDWDNSGKRLVQLSSYSDGSASELLCSTIAWRKYIYGDKVFKENWFKYGKQEGIDIKTLNFFFERCNASLYDR